MQSPNNNGRAQVTKIDDGIYIVIPSAKNWFVLGFLAFWLCAWSAGEVFGIVALIGMQATGGFSFVSLFMLGWLGGWTIGGCFAARELLWGIVGTEQIIATPKFLSVTRSYRFWSSEDNYAAQDVKNLRTVSADGPYGMPLGGNSLASPKKNGTGEAIKFHFGLETRGFGIGLDSAEARKLLDDIKLYFPND